MRRFGGRRAVFLRVIAIWLITAATLILLSALLSGIEVTSFGAPLVAAALIGLFNALVWPLLIRLALPFTVLTLGIGVLVLNGAMVLAVAAISQGHAHGAGDVPGTPAPAGGIRRDADHRLGTNRRARRSPERGAGI